MNNSTICAGTLACIGAIWLRMRTVSVRGKREGHVKRIDRPREPLPYIILFIMQLYFFHVIVPYFIHDLILMKTFDVHGVCVLASAKTDA